MSGEDTDIPLPGVDRELMARAKSVVDGLDQTVRNDSTRGLEVYLDGEAERLPLLDVTTDGRGELQVVRLLGAGGMAHIKLARQRALKRDVALKMVSPEEASPTMADALLREGVVTGRLEHPNIVPVYMLGMDRDGQPIIVMKRVEGVPWSRLERGDAERQRSVWSGDPVLRHLEVFLQVCSAVSYSHARGYVHRDIKADNVMIGTFGEVYLLDWGIATRIGTPAFEAPPGEHVVPTPTGTATYMAPEMIHADGIIDERTDVYLLGATLHRMLTGRTRHQGKNLYELLAAALASKPHVYDADFPDELATICNRATAASPADRFQTAAALREAVVDYLRHKTSFDLAAEAERLLERLETLTEDASKSEDLRSLFAECRFAFRHALREWPGNEAAQDGLRRVLELMIAVELANDHLGAAAGLLSELDEPSPKLEERLARAREARAAEQARVESLRELAYQLDPGVAAAPRALLIAILAVVSVVILAAGLLGFSADDVHARAVWTIPPFLIVLLGFGAFRREQLLSNLASRRLMAIVGITFVTMSLHRVLGYFARPLFPFQLSGDLLLLATGGACLAIIANRWVFAASGVWALGACALIFYPGEPLHIFGPCSALGVAILALVWWNPASRRLPEQRRGTSGDPPSASLGVRSRRSRAAGWRCSRSRRASRTEIRAVDEHPDPRGGAHGRGDRRLAGLDDGAHGARRRRAGSAPATLPGARGAPARGAHRAAGERTWDRRHPGQRHRLLRSLRRAAPRQAHRQPSLGLRGGQARHGHRGGSCYYAEACLGGCSWTAHVLFGRRGNNPFCHHRALELLREGKRERIQRVQAPPGEPFDFGRFACTLEDWPADELERARELAETGEGFLLTTVS